MKRGLTLIELIITILILCLLALITLSLAGNILKKAKVVSAKTQIAQIAQALEMVKDDTGSYPFLLSDLLLTNSPPGMKGWRGPYCLSILLDPWGNEYFYNISEIFESPPVIRTTGHPGTQSFSFQATGQTITIRVENYGVASAWIEVNGTRIFNPSDFSNNPPYPNIYERDVILQDGNNIMSVWAASGPNRDLIVYIVEDLSGADYFVLGSYGMDGVSGGEGFSRDIKWRSNMYPNFH